MSIETSFFGGRSPKERRVCIAKYTPRGWTGLHAKNFAPSNFRAEDWMGAYRADLEERFPTPSSLRLYLESIQTRVPDPILCCYEMDPAECHRSVLAAFIKENLNLDVPEWNGRRHDGQFSLLP